MRVRRRLSGLNWAERAGSPPSRPTGPGGNVIAGDVFRQEGLEITAGMVSFMNHDQGYFRLSGDPGDETTGLMVRLNDPAGGHTAQHGNGCHGRPNCSPHAPFTEDPDNYTDVISWSLHGEPLHNAADEFPLDSVTGCQNAGRGTGGACFAISATNEGPIFKILDPRVSPGGCSADQRDANPQPLPPFPFEGFDPRNQPPIPRGSAPHSPSTGMSRSRRRCPTLPPPGQSRSPPLRPVASSRCPSNRGDECPTVHA